MKRAADTAIKPPVCIPDQDPQPQLASHQQVLVAPQAQQDLPDDQHSEPHQYQCVSPQQESTDADRQLQLIPNTSSKVQSSNMTAVADGPGGVRGAPQSKGHVRKARQRRNSPLAQAGKLQKSRAIAKQVAAPVRRSQRVAQILQVT